MPNTTPVIQPDLSSRPFRMTAERTMAARRAHAVPRLDEQFDLWFAAPGTVLMKPEVNAPLLRDAARGRASSITDLPPETEADRIVEVTWITAAGTKGADARKRGSASEGTVLQLTMPETRTSRGPGTIRRGPMCSGIWMRFRAAPSCFRRGPTWPALPLGQVLGNTTFAVCQCEPKTTFFRRSVHLDYGFFVGSNRR
jgi:hypothetical protein